VKKIMLPLLAVAVLLGTLSIWASPAARTEKLTPVAVVSMPGYNEVFADIELVGKLSDNPDLAKGLEALLKLFTKNEGLAGLDKARPWGAVIQSDGKDLTGYGFLPVTDLEKLLAVMEPFVGKAEDAGDGMLKVKGKGPKKKTLYIVEKNGWAFFSEKPESLAAVAADPLKLLGDLPEQYDLALRIDADKVPETQRRKIINQIRKDTRKDLKRRDAESDRQYAARKKITRQIAQVIVTVVEDLDDVTIGWSLDHKAEQASLEVIATAKQGTEFAQMTAGLRKTASRFGGFRLSNAALSGNWTGTMPKQKVEILNTVLEAIRQEALADIEKEDKPKEEKEFSRKLVGDLYAVLKKTVDSARVDGGMAVLLDPQSVTVLAGGYVADPATLEKLSRQITEIVRAENPVVGSWVKLDADKCQGVRLHTVSIPIPDDADDREKVVKLIGEKLEVAIGLGKESMFVAAGRNALGTLKQVIEQSVSEASQTGPPVQLSLALRPVAQFVAEVGEPKDRPKAKAIAEVLSEVSGSDRINLTAEAVPNGVKYRLQIKQGVLRLLGKIQQINSAE